MPSGCWYSATSELRTQAMRMSSTWTLRKSASRLAGCFEKVGLKAGWEPGLRAQAHHRPRHVRNQGLGSARDEYRTFTPNGSCVAFATPPLAADWPLQTRHTPSYPGPRRSPPSRAGSSASRFRLYSDEAVGPYKNLLTHDQFERRLGERPAAPPSGCRYRGEDGACSALTGRPDRAGVASPLGADPVPGRSYKPRERGFRSALMPGCPARRPRSQTSTGPTLLRSHRIQGSESPRSGRLAMRWR